MHDQAVHRARIISSVAATVISLACGTNYVYSAWAPQFADKLKLSATQSNLIGLAGNLGMYSMGVPIGMVIDSKGPRPAVIVGSVLLGLGYYPLKLAFDAGAGSVAFFCLVSYLTGLGGCMAFAAAVKTSALNWPHHRGTATAFPLAAFGLSAFFFSAFGSMIVPGDTSAFLLLLALGTFALPFVGFFFLRVLPHAHVQHYHSLAGEADTDGGNPLRRTISEEAKAVAAAAAAAAGALSSTPSTPKRSSGRGHYSPDEPGRSPAQPLANSDAPYTDEIEAEASGSGNCEADGDTPLTPDRAVNYATVQASSSTPASGGVLSGPALAAADDAGAGADPLDETSSLMSRSSSLPGEVLVQNSVDMDQSHRIDIRGWTLLRNVEFWQFFAIMGILAGIGLMSINNIGHVANALWKHFDPTVDDSFLVAYQQIHVSILSIGSFTGRLLSGVGSDFLVKRLHASRVWCLAFAAAIFVTAQLCAIYIENPHFLGLVSGLSGLGYGFLFGVFPSIVAESFGIHGLSQNWGFMTLSPVLSGNVFNLFYGAVFDAHSIIEPSGERSCDEGIACYRAAYFVTLAACGVGLVVTLLVIRHQRLQREKEAGKRSLED